MSNELAPRSRRPRASAARSPPRPPTPPPTCIYSSRGGSPLWDCCYGKADSTALPPDPRSLVQPGVSAGRAVAFNAFWKDCHVDPVAVQEVGHATTCGELRAALLPTATRCSTPARTASARSSRATTRPRSSRGFGTSTLTAAPVQHALDDAGAASCSGPTTSTSSSPSATARRSAPAAIPTRSRSRIRTGPTAAAAGCPRCSRSSATPTARGAGGSASPATPATAARSNGTLRARRRQQPAGPAPAAARRGAARLPAVARGARQPDPHARHQQRERHQPRVPVPRRGLARRSTPCFGVLASGSTASMDTPAWWNMGHRPVKFVDGVFPMDAPRVDMVFYTPFFGLFGSLGGPISEAGQDWMRAARPRPQHLDRDAEGARRTRRRSTPRSPSRAR